MVRRWTLEGVDSDGHSGGVVAGVRGGKGVPVIWGRINVFVDGSRVVRVCEGGWGWVRLGWVILNRVIIRKWHLVRVRKRWGHREPVVLIRM